MVYDWAYLLRHRLTPASMILIGEKRVLWTDWFIVTLTSIVRHATWDNFSWRELIRDIYYDHIIYIQHAHLPHLYSMISRLYLCAMIFHLQVRAMTSSWHRAYIRVCHLSTREFVYPNPSIICISDGDIVATKTKTRFIVFFIHVSLLPIWCIFHSYYVQVLIKLAMEMILI